MKMNLLIDVIKGITTLSIFFIHIVFLVWIKNLPYLNKKFKFIFFYLYKQTTLSIFLGLDYIFLYLNK